MERHEVEALAEKVGLSIALFRNNRIIGGTKIELEPVVYGTEEGNIVHIYNKFFIQKQNEVWIGGEPFGQRTTIIFKIDESLEVVFKAISDKLKMFKSSQKSDSFSMLKALFDIQYQLLVTDVIDERHIHIKNKNLDFPPTKDQWLNFYTPIVESYYQSNTEWTVTLELIDDGWLIYSEDLDVFRKPKQVETLEEAVKLVTAQYSPPRANLDPRKKYI